MQQNALNVKRAYGSNKVEVPAFATKFSNMFNMPVVRLMLFVSIANAQLSTPIVQNVN